MTDVGRRLTEAIERPERHIEYRLLSRLNMAALYAVIDDVKPIIDGLEDKNKRDEACRFCGWLVGQQMRSMGYSLAENRRRVRGGPFRSGSVWKIVDYSTDESPHDHK